jgi:hypothetical protein
MPIFLSLLIMYGPSGVLWQQRYGPTLGSRLVYISAEKLAIVTKVFCGFYCPLNTNARISILVRLWLLPSKSSPIHYSSVIVPFSAI